MPSETCDRIRVERYYLEEAGVEEHRETGRHLETCGRCREQLDSLARERDGYLAVHPYATFAAKRAGRRAAGSAVARPRWLPALAGGLALVAVVAVLQGPGLGLQGGSAQPQDAGTQAGDAEDGSGAAGTGGDDVTYKGGESLEFHYRRDGKVLEGRLDGEYRAGDELQFLYGSGKHSHVTLLSVDASGKVSLYRASGSGPGSLPAKAGKLEPFPFGVTLDEARGGELFVALFSQGPVADAALETWLADAFRGATGSGAHTDAQSGGAQAGTTGALVALEKALRPPADAPSGVVKSLLLRKAAP